MVSFPIDELAYIISVVHTIKIKYKQIWSGSNCIACIQAECRICFECGFSKSTFISAWFEVSLKVNCIITSTLLKILPILKFESVIQYHVYKSIQANMHLPDSI